MCLFNADGKLTAGLSAFVKIGFGFFSLTKHFNIAEVTLLDFTFGCDPDAQEPPVLAGQSGDVLTLNMGPRADDRRSVNIKDEDENFKVTHVAGVAGNETIKVSAFGAEQTFTGVGHIVAEGGLGNDTITLEEGVLATAELWGDFKDPARAGDFGDDTRVRGRGRGDSARRRWRRPARRARRRRPALRRRRRRPAPGQGWQRLARRRHRGRRARGRRRRRHPARR